MGNGFVDSGNRRLNNLSPGQSVAPPGDRNGKWVKNILYPGESVAPPGDRNGKWVNDILYPGQSVAPPGDREWQMGE